MNDVADPTLGWSFPEVLNTDAGNAAHDIYGKLYAHVGSILGDFTQRLSDAGAKFELHNIDLLNLKDVYPKASFDRIEVNTIMDPSEEAC